MKYPGNKKPLNHPVWPPDWNVRNLPMKYEKNLLFLIAQFLFQLLYQELSKYCFPKCLLCHLWIFALENVDFEFFLKWHAGT